MQAYEFPTHLVKGTYPVIPQEFVGEIPAGSALRVILLVEDSEPSYVNGESKIVESDSTSRPLLELITRIQSKPSDPGNIRPGNMALLAERLANPVAEPDPSFDPMAWDRQWAQLEADLDANEEAEEHARLKALMP